MEFIIGAAKIFASIVLLALLIAGVFKANPRTHNPDHHALAEYTAGFLICCASVAAFYYLWF